MTTLTWSILGGIAAVVLSFVSVVAIVEGQNAIPQTQLHNSVVSYDDGK